MAIYIKKLNIDAFKGIQNLTLDHMNHINILTGDNNSGKTTILELLRTLENPTSFMTWYRNARTSRFASPGGPYRALMNVFPVDEEIVKLVRYEYLDWKDKLHFVEMGGEVEEVQITEKQLSNLDRIYYKDDRRAEESELYETNALHIEINTDLAPSAHYEVYELQEMPPRVPFKKTKVGIKAESWLKAIYVSPTAHANPFTLDDVLSDSELYSEMLTILKEFDDNIINISASDMNRNYQPEYIILTKNHKNALPLSSYGDGMKKAMLLLSSMLSAKNGILLLDEFETAIHTSAMDHVFSWLLKSAMRLNVQVFLTSHSLEAINKVLRCDKSLLQNISYYTLFNYQGKNLVRYLSAEDAILLQDQGGMDLR